MVNLFRKYALRRQLRLLSHDEYIDLCEDISTLAKQVASKFDVYRHLFVHMMLDMQMHPVGIELAQSAYQKVEERFERRTSPSGTKLALALNTLLVDIRKAAPDSLVYGPSDF